MSDTATVAEPVQQQVQQTGPAPHPIPLAPRAAVAPSIFEPRNLDEAFRLSQWLADSELVPKDYRGKPGNVLVAIQWGAEVGLKPLQSLQNIAIINGRPSMWGDALLALVRASSVCEYVREEWDAAGTAICRVKRRGDVEQVRTFSIEDSKTAKLIGKEGPWQTNPKRMRQLRARSFALRDVFTDVLRGFDIAEVLQDHELGNPPPPPAPVQQQPEDPVIKELRDKADKTAKAGVAALQEFWKAITREQRHALRSSLGGWKAIAEQADSARTLDAEQGPSAAEADAADPFLQSLNAEEQRLQEGGHS